MTEYFTISEFDRNAENWYELCNPRLLVLLDTFRHLTGRCIISPHPRAIGRYDGNSTSQHNYDKWGQVNAIDVFPTLHPKDLSRYSEEELYTWAIAEEWVHYAKMINFSGIGLYPQWTYNGKQRCGLHLDVRDSVQATWGFVDGKMVSLEKAIESLHTWSDYSDKLHDQIKG